MNIILFGPPGVGKSTLIGILKTLGQSAIDLEDLYPNRIRYQIPNLVQNTFIGGADLDPKRQYSGALKVLLFLSQDKYLSRRSARDANRPSKRGQSQHVISDGLDNATYDRIIDVSSTPKQVASSLIQLMNKASHESK